MAIVNQNAFPVYCTSLRSIKWDLHAGPGFNCPYLTDLEKMVVSCWDYILWIGSRPCVHEYKNWRKGQMNMWLMEWCRREGFGILKQRLFMGPVRPDEPIWVTADCEQVQHLYRNVCRWFFGQFKLIWQGLRLSRCMVRQVWCGTQLHIEGKTSYPSGQSRHGLGE